MFTRKVLAARKVNSSSCLVDGKFSIPLTLRRNGLELHCKSGFKQVLFSGDFHSLDKGKVLWDRAHFSQRYPSQQGFCASVRSFASGLSLHKKAVFT